MSKNLFRKLVLQSLLAIIQVLTSRYRGPDGLEHDLEEGIKSL